MDDNQSGNKNQVKWFLTGRAHGLAKKKKKKKKAKKKKAR